MLMGGIPVSRVAVALSGGVDSAVAAWLLLREGHEVLGLSLRLGQGADEAPQSGAQVARQLGIGHQVVEAGPEFAARVVRPSLEDYSQGLTPNPCARCNGRVKFPLLWRAAQAAGCQVLATGHYARLAPAEGGGPALAEATQRAKSQAYFLARLAPELLPWLRFPLAELAKPRVRELAAQAGLRAASRPESQDACFLPAGGWDQLMAEHGLTRPGPLEDQEGRVLGAHGGIHRFTIGQRRGIGIALGQPVYVLALDGARAAVRVGPPEGLMCRGLKGQQARWFIEPPARALVRVRYAHQGVACRLEARGQGVSVLFDEPQRAVAPGQLAVFYRQDQVLGSTWITESIK